MILAGRWTEARPSQPVANRILRYHETSEHESLVSTTPKVVRVNLEKAIAIPLLAPRRTASGASSGTIVEKALAGEQMF